MTVESNCAIAALSDWLNNSRDSFSANKKQNQNPSLFVHAILPLFDQVRVIARNSAWFNMLFAPVVISWTDYFGKTHCLTDSRLLLNWNRGTMESVHCGWKLANLDLLMKRWHNNYIRVKVTREKPYLSRFNSDSGGHFWGENITEIRKWPEPVKRTLM